MKHTRYTHVIWDFNGTLLDDVDASIKSGNRLLRAHGLKCFADVADYREKFGFPVSEYYKRVGFDFSKNPYADLAVEWIAYYLEESKASRLYDDIPQALAKASAAGVKQMILSATERGMLERQLQELGIRQAFDEVLGQIDIHAHGKEEIAKAWRAAHPDATLLLIGDTEHDATVAAAMRADCILLTCGHRPRAVLEAAAPLAVLDRAIEAMEYLEWED